MNQKFKVMQRLLEWRKTYPGCEFEGTIDILDLGYWTSEDCYEPPCFEWRKEFEEERKTWNVIR